MSPHFYWCKKSATPFASLSQAKKIAPSLFESDTFDEKLSYDVYKNTQGEIIFLAYDLKKITAKLKESGLDFTLIKNIYLSQQVCDTMTNPLAFNDDSALALIDGIVVAIDRAYLDEDSDDIETYINAQELKVKKLPIEGLGTFDLTAYKNPLIVLAALFSLTVIMQFIGLSVTQSSLEEQREYIRQANKLPQTQVQLKSIMSRLSKTAKEQNFIRESLYYLSKNRTEVKGRLQQFSVSTQNLDMQFNNPDQALENFIKKGFPKAKMSRGEDLLIVKVQR